MEILAKWNVSKVTTMRGMFRCAVSFNGDISEWDVSKIGCKSDMVSDCHIRYRNENCNPYPDYQLEYDIRLKLRSLMAVDR